MTVRKTLVWAAPLVLMAGWGCGKKKAGDAAPANVQVAEVLRKDVSIQKEFTGQIKGSEDVNIRARVTGILLGIHFKEGSEVRKDALLYTIDPQPFAAKVEEARAAVAEAQALLAKQTQDVERYRPLAKAHAVPQKDLDTALQAQAAAEASVKAHKAALKTAQIDLGYTKIYAPVAGVIGMTQAKVGDLVGNPPAISVLNTISRLDPALVQFSIAEKEYLDLQRRVIESSKGVRRAAAAFQLILADGSVYPLAGRFDFANRQIDPQTGTLTIQASFPNPDKLLRPGLFAKIRAPVEERKGALLVPQRAVLQQQDVFQVFVVGPDRRAQVRSVRIIQPYGPYWIVEGGVQPGESVVVEGVQKVKANMPVNPVPAPAVPKSTGTTSQGGASVQESTGPSASPGAPRPPPAAPAGP